MESVTLSIRKYECNLLRKEVSEGPIMLITLFKLAKSPVLVTKIGNIQEDSKIVWVLGKQKTKKRERERIS